MLGTRIRATTSRVMKGIRTIRTFSIWGSFALFHSLPSNFLILISIGRHGRIKTHIAIVTKTAEKVNTAIFNVSLVIWAALC